MDDSNVLTLKDCIFENNKADDGDDIYGFIATNGMTGGLCLNMSNTLTLVSTNSSSIKSELKAIFDLGGLKVSGYNIKFYLPIYFCIELIVQCQFHFLH